MRLLKTIIIATAVVSLSAATASATVTVTHVDNSGGALHNLMDFFTIDVNVDYNGVGTPLTGIFQSAAWDASEVAFVSATNAPWSIFPGAGGYLSKLSDPVSYSGDAPNTLRTVVFGLEPGQYASAGPTTLITTLTFQIIGGLDGVADIAVHQSLGDGNSGGGTQVGIDAAVLYVVPEPGTALLMGLGLATLGARRRAS